MYIDVIELALLCPYRENIGRGYSFFFASLWTEPHKGFIIYMALIRIFYNYNTLGTFLRRKYCFYCGTFAKVPPKYLAREQGKGF